MIVGAEKVTIRNGHFRVEREYDPSVRVPDIMLNCVGFVGEVTHRDTSGADEGDLHATGFFVSIPIGENGGPPSLVYFVTAKHVAKDLANRELYFLVNKMGGGVTTISTLSDRWYTHPTDPTADVAVVQVADPRNADIRAVNIKSLGTPEMLRMMGIGVGDDVFAVGLFTPVAGSARNEAIVRYGNVAMMPQEQIQTELGYADVYLIEARSIGGLSGCPVFVRPTATLPLAESPNPYIKKILAIGIGSVLLGVMHGHWDIKESEMNKAYFGHDRKHGVNLGIAIVVPAQKILETINQPELIEMREKQLAAVKQQSVPGMDSARPKDESKEPFTKDNFESVLRKVTRKIVPDKK